MWILVNKNFRSDCNTDTALDAKKLNTRMQQAMCHS